MERADNRSQPAVSHLEQMSGRSVRSLLIGDGYAVAIPFFRQAINTYHRGSGPAISFRLDGQVAETGRNDNQAGRKIGSQFIQVRQLLGVVIVRVAENKAVAIGECDRSEEHTS